MTPRLPQLVFVALAVPWLGYACAGSRNPATSSGGGPGTGATAAGGSGGSTTGGNSGVVGDGATDGPFGHGGASAPPALGGASAAMGGAGATGGVTATGGPSTDSAQSTGGSGGAGQGGSGRADAGASDPGMDAAGGTKATGGTNTGGTKATGGANTGPVIGTIENPVISGYFADPQIAQFGGRFYIYPTTDGIASWGATVFHAFSSPDLVAWRDEGIILDLATVSWGKKNAWAPGITVKNGTYYFYFCAAQQIGVATSTSPIGPFKDALGKALVTAGQFGGQSIDPYVFDDDDGRSYLFFGNGNANGAELNADMLSFKTTPKTITTLSGFREGSAVFKRNGKYYFMYSVSGTDYPDYRVAYATSSSPLGPYAGGATILQSNTSLGILSTGHNSVLALSSGDYYIVYHRWAIPNGDGNHREICIDKMTFAADGAIAPVMPTL